jgi:catalase
VHVPTANPSIPQEISHARPAGVDLAEDVDKTFTANLAAARGLRRAWGRAAKIMASAIPPAA